MMIFLIDSHVDAGTNIKTAEEIDTSLTTIDSYIDDVPKETISGLCTYASGGETREEM